MSKELKFKVVATEFAESYPASWFEPEYHLMIVTMVDRHGDKWISVTEMLVGISSSFCSKLNQDGLEQILSALEFDYRQLGWSEERTNVQIQGFKEVLQDHASLKWYLE